MLSGDVELNPGPVIFDDVSTVQGISFKAPDFIFQYRLLRYRLRPLDVGGGGNCFFSNSLIIHHIGTKEITTVQEVWIPGLN